MSQKEAANSIAVGSLRLLRTKVLGKTQIEFAADLGVSVRTYIRYEQKGAPQPIINLCARIAAEHKKGKQNVRATQKAG